jgi:FkbM family methyltransferase
MNNVITNSHYGPIIVNINDSVIGNAVIKNGYWAKDDINLITNIIKKLKSSSQSCKLTVYDVGANIGTHTIALAKEFKDDVTIRAFEAQRQVFYMLCGSVSINNLKNVYCHNNAVSDLHNSTINIGLLDYDSYNNFGALEIEEPVHSDQQNVVKNDAEIIATLALDGFNERVDFIKIDVEGMEHKVLRGARKTIEASRPVCFIEIHKTDQHEVIDYFQSLSQYAGYIKGIDLITVPFEKDAHPKGLNRIF